MALDSSTAIALGGMGIAASSLLMGVLLFANSERRGVVDELKAKVRELQDHVDNCRKERAEDDARHMRAISQQRETSAREMETLRQMHRSDLDAVRADMNFWRELALRHGLGPDNRKEGGS